MLGPPYFRDTLNLHFSFLVLGPFCGRIRDGAAFAGRPYVARGQQSQPQVWKRPPRGRVSRRKRRWRSDIARGCELRISFSK